MTEKLIAGPMVGFKATDKNMCCQGFKYEIGKEYELDKSMPLILCQSGFHFCEQPSGVWTYYSADDTRIFKIEAADILEAPFEPGADFKRVCRKIKFVEEIKIGDSNTGDSNTGYRNTGYRNTGDRNTGYSNTGDRNTGDSNTGDSNTGYRNTGYSNTGDWNTGYRNTGDRNTGYSNTGDWNTGDWNFCDYSTGYFCSQEQPVVIFDKPTEIKRADLPLDLMRELHNKFMQDDDFDATPFLVIPNATADNIKALHGKYIEKRKPVK